jgi:hypothetical protein
VVRDILEGELDLLEDNTLVFKVNKDRLQAAQKQAKQVAAKKVPKPAIMTSPFFWSALRPTQGASMPSGTTVSSCLAMHVQ